mgnify:CR=1 FL=1
MQQDGSAMMPLYQTPDERFVLTSFISGGENAIRIDILNTSGIHFEKWVSIHDDARLAKAIRHKKAYSLPNTQRERPVTTRKASWFLGFF